jgi:peroxin-19
MNQSNSSENDLDAVLNAALDELGEEETAPVTSAVGSASPVRITFPASETTATPNCIQSSVSQTSAISEEEAALIEMMKQMKSLFPSGLSDEANVHVKKSNNKSPKDVKSTNIMDNTVPTMQSDKSDKNHNDIEGVMNHLLSELNKTESNHPINTSAHFMEQMASDLEETLNHHQSSSNASPKEQEDIMGQVVNGMMTQLLSKEFMYEPMKDICQQYPKWLAENKARLSDSEYQNYGLQYQYFQRIVHLYENDPDNTARLTELMNDLQEYGQPPSELVQELAPDLEFDSDGMPKMDGMNMGGFEGLFPPFNSEMMNGKNDIHSEDDCSIM